jgi:rubredoxin
MGKQKRIRSTRKNLREIKVTVEEIEALILRLEQKSLVDADYPLLIELIKNFTTIQNQFKNSTSTVAKLQKLLFGPKTECSQLPSDLKATDTGEPAKGHGKKPIDQWVDEPAQICVHPHDQLHEGQLCPKCNKGKLYPFTPSVRVKIVANRPLDVERHEVERLRCSACGWLYTATPNADFQKAPDASPEAMAMSALLRYQSGFPIYRMRSFLAAQGVFLTWTKIWSLIEGVFDVAVKIFEILWELSANCTLAQNDDTPMKVIDLMRANKTKTKKERKAIQTTGLVMHLPTGQKIMLFKTGHKNAGENLEDILSHRTDPDPPMQMADALAANGAGNEKTNRGGCLDHFRRDFYDLYSEWTQQCELILGHLRAVYKIDARSKKLKLSPQKRLQLHQLESTPHMSAIYEWMSEQFPKRQVEPNSNLGNAIKYGLNHWPKLTAFLRLPGMPISNIDVERLLKKAVIHRKNSLFYKNPKGALVGDVLMSVIQTATAAQQNVFKYLTALVTHQQDVKDQPEKWLPWLYLQRLDELKPAHT